MKKRFLYILLLVLILIPSVALADMGPKPSINIKAVNMPDSECYMDLLVEVSIPGETDKEFLGAEYNQYMVEALSSYYEDGWGPAVVNAERIIFDDIKCEISAGECVKSFGYMPPDRFKIIVISESGEIVVSNVIERKAFNSSVSFDFSTGDANENGIWSLAVLQFLVTCILTLLIEGGILVAFRFSFKKYWIPFVTINVITQLILNIAIIWIMTTAGGFAAVIVYILAEIFIFIVEIIAFAIILKQHSVGRRIAYAFSANLISFFLGLVMMFVF